MANDYPPVSVELNDVHNRLYRKLNLEKEASKNNPRAEKMQELLRYLKNSPNESGINNIFKDLFTQKIQVKGLKGVKHLFHKKGGTQFELEFSALMQAIETKGDTKSITVKKDESHHVGNWSAGLKEDAIKIIEKNNKKIQEIIIENILEEANNGSTVEFLTPAKRAGKTDVTGVTTVTREIKENWVDAVKAFENGNFTLKNYGDSSDIKLGKTAPTRVYFSMLLSLMNAKNATHIYYHSYYSYRNSIAKVDIEKHFYHLRFAYELAGYGLTYFKKENNEFTKQDLGHADFIIYNNPTTEDIYVRSTAQVILDELNHNDNRGVGSNPFETHTTRIRKSYFTGIEKNKT